MKNAHGVEPTRYMKKENSKTAIDCCSDYGPIFRCGMINGSDICIANDCNENDSCWIQNDGTRGYECHPEYKSSLFVETNGPDKKNSFSVLDYEVYTH